MGCPVKLQVQRNGGKGKRREPDRPPPLSREKRLRQRNAKKEALAESIPVDTEVEGIEESGEVTPEPVAEICEQITSVDEVDGEQGDAVESGEAIANVVWWSAISMAECESKRETLLRVPSHVREETCPR